jgi:acyl-coenzyme A thioesterase PaaI-like protein
MDTDNTIFQDVLPADLAVCWGCGHSNLHGLQIKSRWEGDEAVCEFQPQSHHTAYPGVLNGGIIATIIDCHCINTAMANIYRAEGRPHGSDPQVACVTGEMNIRYLKPTPLDSPVTLRARITTVEGRKTRVQCSLFSQGEECARGDVLAVRLDNIRFPHDPR